jgi:3-hydroxybutyryl-CoA dehydrogenase
MSPAINIFPIGIIGAGTMGCGVCELAVAANHIVCIFDNDIENLYKAEGHIQKYFQGLTQKGRITSSFAEEALSRVHYVTDIKALEKSRLVLEAIPESLPEKQKVLQAVEAVISESSIIASNTSSLSIASLGSVLKHPERFLGIHFFNPATAMALVEVVPGLLTMSGTVQVAKNLIESWGKIAVLSKDTPGFIVNRIVRPFFSESLRILEAGESDVSTIDWALKTVGQFKMGPFELLDFVGIDTNWVVSKSIFEGFFFEPRFRPSLLQSRLVEAKRLGRKTGAGFYEYSEGVIPPAANENSTIAERIFNRVFSMIVNEASDALTYGVGTKEDIDTAVVKGVNFPQGVFVWADSFGIHKVVEILDELYAEFGEPRYRVCGLLRKMVAENRKFYS